MKAIILKPDSFGVEEVAIPELKSGQALIKIQAAALNRRDQWIREGMYPKIVLPAQLGSDGCGIVEKVADVSAEHLLGKRVIINPNIGWGEHPSVQLRDYHILGMPSNGTLAEYVAIDTDRLHEAPPFLSNEEAGALPLAGLTAYNAIVNKGGLTASKKVLISGVGGGVAQMALQFGLAAGARCWVSSGKKHVIEQCVQLGAQGGADYRQAEAMKQMAKDAGGFDIIIDSAGGKGMSELIMMLAPGGSLVFYGATVGNTQEINLRYMFWNQLSLKGSTMGSDQDFKNMLAFVATHKIEPIIDQVFELKDAVAAFDRMKSGQHFGKIVIKPSH
jgi:zinc-binding alcohol dehydrogenase/oxidoreductase